MIAQGCQYAMTHTEGSADPRARLFHAFPFQISHRYMPNRLMSVTTTFCTISAYSAVR
jgi:hypothetical protein